MEFNAEFKSMNAKRRGDGGRKKRNEPPTHQDAKGGKERGQERKPTADPSSLATDY
jgi:hypothetical protein